MKHSYLIELLILYVFLLSKLFLCGEKESKLARFSVFSSAVVKEASGQNVPRRQSVPRPSVPPPLDQTSL